MLDAGVIMEVHEATPWINSFVIVETVKGRKKKLRTCLDPMPLNKATMCEPYIICTPDDVYHKLANAKYITVIDFKKSFWQFVLDEESSYLTTFNTQCSLLEPCQALSVSIYSIGLTKECDLLLVVLYCGNV